MAPGIIPPSNKRWIRDGTGRSERFYFYRGRKANLHGTLMVAGELVGIAFVRRLKKWYQDYQLFIWFWTVFFTWITLGAMVGLMFYAVMP